MKLIYRKMSRYSLEWINIKKSYMGKYDAIDDISFLSYIKSLTTLFTQNDCIIHFIKVSCIISSRMMNQEKSKARAKK